MTYNYGPNSLGTLGGAQQGYMYRTAFYWYTHWDILTKKPYRKTSYANESWPIRGRERRFSHVIKIIRPKASSFSSKSLPAHNQRRLLRVGLKHIRGSWAEVAHQTKLCRADRYYESWCRDVNLATWGCRRGNTARCCYKGQWNPLDELPLLPYTKPSGVKGHPSPLPIPLTWADSKWLPQPGSGGLLPRMFCSASTSLRWAISDDPGTPESSRGVMNNDRANSEQRVWPPGWHVSEKNTVESNLRWCWASWKRPRVVMNNNSAKTEQRVWLLGCAVKLRCAREKNTADGSRSSTHRGFAECVQER